MNFLKANFKNIGYVVGIFILVIIVVRFQQRISEMIHLEGQLKLIQTQELYVTQTLEGLLTKVAVANSDEAVKEWAYSEGRWYLPNETPVMPLPLWEATPTPQGQELPPVATVENYKVWWELFFGGKN
jgi:hypothetical protein